MNISHLKRVRIISLALHLVTGTTAYAEPGAKMYFSIANPQSRANVIAYLAQQK